MVKRSLCVAFHIFLFFHISAIPEVNVVMSRGQGHALPTARPCPREGTAPTSREPVRGIMEDRLPLSPTSLLPSLSTLCLCPHFCPCFPCPLFHFPLLHQLSQVIFLVLLSLCLIICVNQSYLFHLWVNAHAPRHRYVYCHPKDALDMHIHP